MLNRSGSHLRRNAIAYLALFIALAAMAYALSRDEVRTDRVTEGHERVGETDRATTGAEWQPAATLRLYVAGSAQSRHVTRALRVVTGQVPGASAYPARGIWRDDDDSTLFDERATVIEAVVSPDSTTGKGPNQAAVPVLRTIAEEASAAVFRTSGERATYAVIVGGDGATVSAEIRR